jgi:hypothetical protein
VRHVPLNMTTVNSILAIRVQSAQPTNLITQLSVVYRISSLPSECKGFPSVRVNRHVVIFTYYTIGNAMFALLRNQRAVRLFRCRHCRLQSAAAAVPVIAEK